MQDEKELRSEQLPWSLDESVGVPGRPVLPQSPPRSRGTLPGPPIFPESTDSSANRNDAGSPLHPHAMEGVGLSLSRYAATCLREAILQGSLQPRDRLVESNLAHQLNLSRGPIRDALKQLEHEGLVVIIPRRGAFVSHLERSDVWEIASLRAVVEGLAARILAERKNERAAVRLEAVLQEMAAVGDENPVRFATLDLRFHETLVRAAEHKRLLQFWTTLRTQIWMFIRETRLGGLRPAGSTIEIHRAILDAIRAGDAIEAERVARSHSELSGRQLEAHLRD